MSFHLAEQAEIAGASRAPGWPTETYGDRPLVALLLVLYFSFALLVPHYFFAPPGATMSSSSGDRQGRRERRRIRISPIDDPKATHLHVIYEEDGNSTYTASCAEQSAVSSARATAAAAPPAPACSADYEWGTDSGDGCDFGYSTEADPHAYLRDSVTTPVVCADDVRADAVFLLSSGGKAPYYFTRLADVRTTSGSRALAARCTCSPEGVLQGEKGQSNVVAVLQHAA